MKISDAIKRAIDSGCVLNEEIAYYINKNFLDFKKKITGVDVKKVRNRYLNDYEPKASGSVATISGEKKEAQLPSYVRQATPDEAVSLSAKSAAALAGDIRNLDGEVSEEHIVKILDLALLYGITEVKMMTSALIRSAK